VEDSFLVLGNKSWNERIFNQIMKHYPGQWHFIGAKKDLVPETIESLSPRYIFFLHWSWKVPQEIIDKYECVCFHMTDVPYGRGGSPLQNLIVRGHRKTKLTALRMTEEFDAGPVYMKEDLSLEGNAEEIYIRATRLAVEMIERIIREKSKPVPQEGDVTVFERRKPEQSEIPHLDSLENLHDFIRMLDAEGYPKAFITYKGFKYEFNRSALYNGRIKVDVTITPIEENSK
jgi:methionyl-tRNA formyltransferase